MADIVVADDHPIMLSGIEAVLSAAGHRIVSSSSTGAGALAAVGGDLFLIDQWMPGGTGIDVLRALRVRGDQRPLILMTASINADRLQEALDLGVAGIVLKASMPAQLLACIRDVLAGRRWIDPALRASPSAGPALRPAGPLDQLTSRERAIVQLVASGLRNRDIGLRQGMTEGNVKVTLHRIYERLGISNRVELAMLARSLGDPTPAAA